METEEEKNRIETLKKAIEEGINSGIAVDFDPEQHLLALQKKEDERLDQL